MKPLTSTTTTRPSFFMHLFLLYSELPIPLLTLKPYMSLNKQHSYSTHSSLSDIPISFQVMEAFSPKGFSVSSSPYSSPNLSALLKIKTISWSQETGLPVAIQVQVANRIFNLHKLPLSSRSGYLKRHLQDNITKVELPPNFPGGSETFEMIALFIYGSSTFIDPFNVAALRCAAELLEMKSEYGDSTNLCERTDLYLNQAVLQNWDDTLIVLQKCQTLLPYAEDLLIVSRCIESLAFMACMEILDPEGKRDRPGLSLEALASQPWSCERVKEVVCQHLWIKDLITLPFGFFKRVITSLRRQGMKDKYVSPIIVFYANKWVLSKKRRQFWECLCDNNNGDFDTSDDKVLEILQGVLDLLPTGEKAGRVIPVGFYFSTLARSIELGMEGKGRNQLQWQAVLGLPSAHVEDFLLPKIDGDGPISSAVEVKIMVSIFAAYISSKQEMDVESPPTCCTIVAELWDSYLSQIVMHRNMEPGMLLDLIQTVPVSYRQRHDHLYRAVAAFLQVHPSITEEEKSSVCQYLNCQKLSQEICIEAVQNELMPLRLIVQALFVQQLNTQHAFKECSQSLRYTNCVDFSGSISSYLNHYKSQNLGESPYKDSAMAEPDDISAKEYESTSFRIQNLELELSSLKKSLQLQKQCKETTELAPAKRSLSKRRNPVGQGCISSVNFSSQRRYAGRIMRVFRKMILFGREKPKRRSGTHGCRRKSV